MIGRNASGTFVEPSVVRGGHKIYVRDYRGSGPAFVLMHGFPDNLHIYDELAQILAAKGHRVVTFDFLGYGGSDKPADHSYSARGLEDDLHAVVETLRIAPIIPVAHDASGPTAINWSLEHPDWIAKLVLLNCYYGSEPTLKFPELISLFADPAYRDLARAIISDPEQFGWLLTFQGNQFGREAPVAFRERAQKILVPAIRAQFRATPSAAIAFMSLTAELHSAVFANTKRVPEFAKFRKPVELIWGAGDPYLNVGVAQNIKNSFCHSKLTPLRLGHWPQIDAPEEVAKALLS